MKRDWEIIRSILIAAENMPVGGNLNSNDMREFDIHVVAEHMRMLNDAGYVDARTVGLQKPTSILLRVNMSGYDLLHTIRSDTLWNKIKSTAKDKGVELTFDVIKAIGAAILPQVLG